jgi:hypothetical protein
MHRLRRVRRQDREATNIPWDVRTVTSDMQRVRWPRVDYKEAVSTLSGPKGAGTFGALYPGDSTWDAGGT